jgi:hypothetical protein
MSKALLLAWITVMAPVAFAQRTNGPAHGTGSGKFAGPAFAPMKGFRGFMPSGHHHGSSALWPLSLLGDSPLGDSTATPESPLVLLQNVAGTLAPAEDRPRTNDQALLIELQGDRYVQLSGAAEPAERSLRVGANPIVMKSGRASQPDAGVITNIPGTATHVSRQRARANTATAAGGGMIRGGHSGAPMPPAVVVYRDGKREEVLEYSIADGVLYATGDYYRDGYWNKKIELTALDLPETEKANEDRGLKFVLPEGPNYVVMKW